MDGFVLAIIIIAMALVLVAVGICFFIRKKCRGAIENADEVEPTEMVSVINMPIHVQSSTNMLALVEKIEIANRLGQSLMLSSVDSSTALSTRKFQEITARGTAIGAILVQGAMPALAHAQTLAQIAQAAPNGLFTVTAPLTELMRYSDGTVGSIVMKGEKIANHSGFQQVALSVANPAAVVGAGMQAMAMISGQYYMDKISNQLDGIEHGIERLIGFHHDENIGKLRSIENRMREIIGKKHVDETDIIALQSGIREADSVLMEYSPRLERLSKTGEITEVQVRALWSRLSAAKELKNLRANTEEHELYYSFQICLFASKLMLASKKAEFATRMKIGETEKAMEAFESFNTMYRQSFLSNASDFLSVLYKPINAKAESLVKRQWFESKKAKGELESIEAEKADLQGYIGIFVDDGSDEEMMRSFTDDSEILYLPSGDGFEQRVFISVKDEGEDEEV
ncbi:MAG: hypothetical protein LBK75_01735 [Oscillospiraceae bacterium]|jgi:hypothetical protein|nr:hypothetical protein [Oscillospiraceae bacterium]